MGKLNIDLGKVLATQGGKQAILVIDDSNIARKTLAKNLEYYGFEIFEAATGIEGSRRHEIGHRHRIGASRRFPIIC